MPTVALEIRSKVLVLHFASAWEVNAGANRAVDDRVNSSTENHSEPCLTVVIGVLPVVLLCALTYEVVILANVRPDGPAPELLLFYPRLSSPKRPVLAVDVVLFCI